VLAYDGGGEEKISLKNVLASRDLISAYGGEALMLDAQARGEGGTFSLDRSSITEEPVVYAAAGKKKPYSSRPALALGKRRWRARSSRRRERNHARRRSVSLGNALGGGIERSLGQKVSISATLGFSLP